MPMPPVPMTARVTVSLGGLWPGPPRTRRGTIVSEAAAATAPPMNRRLVTFESELRFMSCSRVCVPAGGILRCGEGAFQQRGARPIVLVVVLLVVVVRSP
jgi:hypothetical protein